MRVCLLSDFFGCCMYQYQYRQIQQCLYLGVLDVFAARTAKKLQYAINHILGYVYGVLLFYVLIMYGYYTFSYLVSGVSGVDLLGKDHLSSCQARQVDNHELILESAGAQFLELVSVEEWLGAEDAGDLTTDDFISLNVAVKNILRVRLELLEEFQEGLHRCVECILVGNRTLLALVLGAQEHGHAGLLSFIYLNLEGDLMELDKSFGDGCLLVHVGLDDQLAGLEGGVDDHVDGLSAAGLRDEQRVGAQVEIVDDNRAVLDSGTGTEPSQHLLLGVDLLTEVDHLSVVVLIHEHASLLVILMDDSEAVGHLDDSTLSDVSHEGTDAAIGIFGSAGEGVADGENTGGVHAHAGVGELGDNVERLQILSHRPLLGQGLDVVGILVRKTIITVFGFVIGSDHLGIYVYYYMTIKYVL